MGKIIPHDYQEDAVSALFEFMIKRAKQGMWGRHPLVVAPTASGKSVIIARFIQLVLDTFPRSSSGKPTKILSLVNDAPITLQNHEAAEKMLDFKCGIFTASIRKDFNHQVTFGTIKSVHPTKEIFRDLGKIDILIVDEAQQVGFKDDLLYRQYIDFLLLKNPKLLVVGITATDFRVDGGMLIEGDNRLFTDKVYEIPVKILMDRGYLCNIITPANMNYEIHLDDADLKLNRYGEYTEKSQAEAADNNIESFLYSALDDAVSHLVKQGRKKWIMFLPSSKTCIAATEYLNNLGFKGGYSLSSNTKQENKAALYEFECGDAVFLINLYQYTTGYNFPPIDAVCILRKMNSLGMYLQMIGRGARTWADKLDCLLLDYGENIIKHGFFDVPNYPKKKVKGGEMPYKFCPEPNCDPGKQHKILASLIYCPNCGALIGDPEPKPKHLEVADTVNSALSFKQEPVINTYDIISVKPKMVTFGGKSNLVVDFKYGSGRNEHLREFLNFELTDSPNSKYAIAHKVKWIKQNMSASDFLAVQRFTNNFESNGLVYEALVNGIGQIRQPSKAVIDETNVGKQIKGKKQYPKLKEFIYDMETV